MRISDWSSDVCSSDLSSQAVEQYELVQAVEELRPEMGTDNLHYLRFHILHLLPFRKIGEILAAQIAGQDDQRVAEIHGAALSVCQAAIIKDLKQDVAHVAVRLFHSVKQPDLTRLPPDKPTAPSVGKAEVSTYS